MTGKSRRVDIPGPGTIMPRAIEEGDARSGAVHVEGKFFFQGNQKFFAKGVTYGPFTAGSHGRLVPERKAVERDFALIRELGANTVRLFTVPPRWLLDVAGANELKVMVGLPWSYHLCFLDSPTLRGDARRAVAKGVRECREHPALFAYLVGNEIPPDIVRWHGPEAVRGFLLDLYSVAKDLDPTALVSYANYPSTEYLNLDFADFLSFNIYLHREPDFRRYISRLQNLAVDRPLVLTEFGIDSIREGEEHQADILSWQIRAAFESGVAGTCVFAFTDEWFTGSVQVHDWAFGLVDTEREPKPAYRAVQQHYQGALPPALPEYPKVSVVVCAYNADRTMDQCLASLEHLNYPNYEVVVVNDGSNDRTLEICRKYDYIRLFSQDNKGLSVARNVGLELSTGDIVAYTDSDCVADPDWLTYLVAKFLSSGLQAVGGPNFPPPEDSLVPSCVAVSPGGPTHVLLGDDVAEHIAGCNMAFRAKALREIGGFDPQFRAAGDDIDICWRLQNAGYTIGFSPAAVVWHFRRNTVAAYIGQQRGYGKAEALVYAKHPFRFNLFGQARWLGRIYGDLFSALFSRRPVIYSGTFGRGLFQTMYEPPSSLMTFLPMSFEWNLAAAALFVWAAIEGDWAWIGAAPLAITWTRCVGGAWRAPVDKRFRDLRSRVLIALLIYLGPLVRGYERWRWRMRGLSSVEQTNFETPSQVPRLQWLHRAFVLSYWNEEGLEKEALLQGLIEFLAPRKYFVVLDEGWSDWDLKIARGLAARAEVKVISENHTGGKRLLRVRCALRLSRLALAGLGAYAGVALLALAFDIGSLAASTAMIGIANAAFIAYKNYHLGSILYQVIEIVAARAGMVPVPANTEK